MLPALVTAIIPTLNEAATIGAAIKSCLREGVHEIIVADGGSTDATATIAQAAGAIILQAQPAQRARQMNAGAHRATGELYIFLHADSTLQPGAMKALAEATQETPAVGGGFQRRYQTDSRLLHITSAIGNARARRLGWFYGDQAIWARAHVFRQLGGFPNIPIFEDLDFTRRLSRVGPTCLISPGIETSARRFQRGALTRLTLDFLLTARHVCLDPKP